MLPLVFCNEDPLASDGQFCQNMKDGVYADIQSECHKFYVCEKTQEYKFSCPEGHRFFQRFETCSYVPPEEEDTFSCEEMSHISELTSQSMDHESGGEEGHVHQMDRRDDHDDLSFDSSNIGSRKIEFTDKHLNEYVKAVLGTSYSSKNDHNIRHYDAGDLDNMSRLQSSGHVEEGEHLSRKESLGCGRRSSGSRVKRSCHGR